MDVWCLWEGNDELRQMQLLSCMAPTQLLGFRTALCSVVLYFASKVSRCFPHVERMWYLINLFKMIPPNRQIPPRFVNERSSSRTVIMASLLGAALSNPPSLVDSAFDGPSGYCSAAPPSIEFYNVKLRDCNAKVSLFTEIKIFFLRGTVSSWTLWLNALKKTRT